MTDRSLAERSDNLRVIDQKCGHSFKEKTNRHKGPEYEYEYVFLQVRVRVQYS